MQLSRGGIPGTIGDDTLMLDFLGHTGQEDDIPDSVYKVIELGPYQQRLMGEGGRECGRVSCKSLRDLRIAEVVKLDMQLDDKG